MNMDYYLIAAASAAIVLLMLLVSWAITITDVTHTAEKSLSFWP
jgi:hypothetical protein